jgi:uncharacterized protein (TIGR02186 family)
VRLVLAVFGFLYLATTVGAEQLASAVSSNSVEITSSFDGAKLSFFGNVQPDTATPDKPLNPPYDVIVVVTGPALNRLARLKTNQFGVWTNTDQVLFKGFPSFFDVLSNRPLSEIAAPELLNSPQVDAVSRARSASEDPDENRSARFGLQLVRLMTQEGHFGQREDGVNFISPTAYTAAITLPSDVANGTFIAHTFLLKDKVVVAERTEAFSVRKTGFERFVFTASSQYPLVYGLVCVALALGTGWLASVVFRR